MALFTTKKMTLPTEGEALAGRETPMPVSKRHAVNGAPIADDSVYRVTMNSFLASGGDNFTVFRDGADMVGGPVDVDALEAYVAKAGRLTPPAADRIKRIN